jgi:hypothetical protein
MLRPGDRLDTRAPSRSHRDDDGERPGPIPVPPGIADLMTIASQAEGFASHS